MLIDLLIRRAEGGVFPDEALEHEIDWLLVELVV